MTSRAKRSRKRSKRRSSRRYSGVVEMLKSPFTVYQRLVEKSREKKEQEQRMKQEERDRMEQAERDRKEQAERDRKKQEERDRIKREQRMKRKEEELRKLKENQKRRLLLEKLVSKGTYGTGTYDYRLKVGFDDFFTQEGDIDRLFEDIEIVVNTQIGGHKFICKYTLKPQGENYTIEVRARDVEDAVHRCLSHTYDAIRNRLLPVPKPLPRPSSITI